MNNRTFDDFLKFEDQAKKDPICMQRYTEFVESLGQKIIRWEFASESVNRSGIDRIIKTDTKTFLIQEKFRKKEFSDMAIEIYQDIKTKQRGWGTKPSPSNILAYWLNMGRFGINPPTLVIFPTKLFLQRVKENYPEWKKIAESNGTGVLWMRWKEGWGDTINICIRWDILKNLFGNYMKVYDI